MTARMPIGRRALLKGAVGLAGATAGSVAWAQGQATPQPPAGGRGAPAPPGVAATWVSSTESAPWQTKTIEPRRGFGWDTLDLRVRVNWPAQVVDGFGACFNELGWTSLQLLSEAERDGVIRELFAPGVGGNFTICRMPVAANDFSRGWYWFDETPDDFDLKRFSVANDQETLIPFIRAARKHQPALRLWASPWSPPSWMKVNAHYAAAQSRGGNASNGLRPDQVGKEGTDMFRLEERYLDAYARYFGKFIDAYREAGIPIVMVMPQNEFNSAQPFPSCLWTGPALARFIRRLGPEMANRGVEVYFGTLERANVGLFEPSMKDPEAARHIKGVGVQWAGKGAVADLARLYPKLKLYQSEQECGDGKNDWRYAGYTWQLMKHYFRSGIHAYMYWNVSLEAGGDQPLGVAPELAGHRGSGDKVVQVEPRVLPAEAPEPLRPAGRDARRDRGHDGRRAGVQEQGRQRGGVAEERPAGCAGGERLRRGRVTVADARRRFLQHRGLRRARAEGLTRRAVPSWGSERFYGRARRGCRNCPPKSAPTPLSCAV